MGYANPDAMLREMSSNQLFEWIAYYQEEPWGVASLDWLFAHFKAIYANAHLRKGKRAYKPDKFLVFGQKKKPAKASPDDFDEDFSEFQ